MLLTRRLGFLGFHNLKGGRFVDDQPVQKPALKHRSDRNRPGRRTGNSDDPSASKVVQRQRDDPARGVGFNRKPL